MSRSQQLRIEDNTVKSFATSRTINSALWFVNNQEFEKRVLGYLAKYQQEMSVTLYALNIQGNHYHLTAHFPLNNRGDFFRNLNARTAEAVRFTVSNFPGGPLFERRYSEQGIVQDEDLEDRFFYSALQPVNAGLCERISEYPGYNSFSDAVSQITRYYEVIDWEGYNRKKRYCRGVKLRDFIRTYPLRFARLPNYEHLSQNEYKKRMLKSLEERRVKIVQANKENGVLYGNSSWLKNVKPGSLPMKTKKSSRHSHRPLYFCSNPELKKEKISWYFSIANQHLVASKAYLAGYEYTVFPSNTYKPPRFISKPPGAPLP